VLTLIFIILGSTKNVGVREQAHCLAVLANGQVPDSKASDRKQGQSFYNFLKILASLTLLSEFNIR
jgi:hypothetical protein